MDQMDQLTAQLAEKAEEYMRLIADGKYEEASALNIEGRKLLIARELGVLAIALADPDPGDDNPHPTDDGPKYPDPDKRAAHHDPDDGAPEPWPPETRRCEACAAPLFALGPLVCWACAKSGHCTVCAGAHVATQCPDVRQARLEMERAELLIHRQMVADAARAIRERYLGAPIWEEAA